MRLIAWLLISVLCSSPAWAARGFGPTDGAASTDVIVSTYQTNHSSSTWSMWVYRTGDGGGSTNWLLANSAGSRHFWYDEAASKLTFVVAFSTFGGLWSMTAPATGGWHHIAWTYDDSSTANDPVMYLDGVSVTVTEDQAPSGTLVNAASPFRFGNGDPTTGHFNGRLAEIGYWNRILSAGEIATIAGGTAYGCAPSGLVAYWPLAGTASPEPESVAGADGTVTGTASQTSPTVSCPSSGNSSLSLLGVGR